MGLDFNSLRGEETCTAWDKLAVQYIAKGFSVIPLAPKQKGPKLQGWSQYCEKLMAVDFAKSFYGNNNNIGLCLGPASGLIAVDIDSDDDAFIKKVESIIPVSPVKKKGAKGYTAFYKYEGQSSWSKKDEAGNGIDFLSTGRQTVLPDSIHPTGMVYRWVSEQTVIDVKKDQYPSISEREVELLRALFKEKEKKVSVSPRKTYQENAADEVTEALSYIDPDHSYEQWIEIGMALQSEFGDAGFDYFNQWSSRGSKYDGVAQCFKKYKSLNNVNQITIATLYHYALERGYVHKSPWSDVEYFGTNEQQEEAKASIEKMFGIGVQTDAVDHLQPLLSPPGFLGEVYDWMTVVTPVIQPVYTIAAAISFVSIVFAQKFKTESNAHSNNYVVAVGASGSGKTKAASAFLRLMTMMPAPLNSMLMGEPKSDAGLIDGLMDRAGKGVIYIDEIGHYLRQIKHGSANAYTANVGAEFTKLFSCADTVYQTGQYSGRAKKASVQIINPCLVIFGQSVKERLFKEIKEDDFIDGFFNRWLIFESMERIPPYNTDYVDIDSNHPTKIIKFVEDLDKWVIEAQLGSNFMRAVTGAQVLKVPKTPGAAEMMTKYSVEVNDRRRKLEEGALYDFPLSRAIEHAEKLSLTACEFQNERPIITEKSMAWAIAATEHNLAKIREKLTQLSSSQYEDDVQRLINSLPKKPMSESEFNNAGKMFPMRQRTEILKDLLKRNILEWIEVDGKTRLVKR